MVDTMDSASREATEIQDAVIEQAGLATSSRENLGEENKKPKSFFESSEGLDISRNVSSNVIRAQRLDIQKNNPDFETTYRDGEFSIGTGTQQELIAQKGPTVFLEGSDSPSQLVINKKDGILTIEYRGNNQVLINGETVQNNTFVNAEPGQLFTVEGMLSDGKVLEFKFSNVEGKKGVLFSRRVIGK